VENTGKKTKKRGEYIFKDRGRGCVQQWGQVPIEAG
jgi:hypothetical protein